MINDDRLRGAHIKKHYRHAKILCQKPNGKKNALLNIALTLAQTYAKCFCGHHNAGVGCAAEESSDMLGHLNISMASATLVGFANSIHIE